MTRQVLFLGSVVTIAVGCGGKKTSNNPCAAGEVFVDNACVLLCSPGDDCGAGKCCANVVNGSGTCGVCAGALPQVLGIDGSDDPRLTITGNNFTDSRVTLALADGSRSWPLTVCSNTDTQIIAELPNDMVKSPTAPTAYLLTVANLAGSCEQTLSVLQGDRGLQGMQGDRGIQGERGLQGDPGPRGDAGGGLVLDFEFDEAGGMPAFSDSSPYGATRGGVGAGSFIGGAPGHSGNAVDFTGSGIVWIQSPAVPDGAQVWIEAWVKPDPPMTSTKVIATKVGSYALKLVNREVAFDLIATADSTLCTATSNSAPIASDGSWQHVAAWYDGLFAVVAVNGAVRGTVACAKGRVAPSLSGAFVIGGNYDGANITQGFDGSIDEVRVRQTSPSLGLSDLLARGQVTSNAGQYASQRLPVELCTGTGCYSEWRMYHHPTNAEAGTPYYRDLLWIHFNPATKIVSLFRVDGNTRWSSWDLDNGPSSWSWYWVGAVGHGECFPMAADGTCNGGDVFVLISFSEYAVGWTLTKLPD